MASHTSTQDGEGGTRQLSVSPFGRGGVAIVNTAGTATDRFTVPASAAGLRELVRRLRRAHVGEVAIERSDGQVVDALFAASVTVVVIPPGQVANLRGRYRSAGNKDDRFDAYVLADTLGTDRARAAPAGPRHPGHHRAALGGPRP